MLSPDLQLVAGVKHPRQVFFLALEDTAPDAWGERVIRRAQAKLRQEDRDAWRGHWACAALNLQDFEPAFARKGGAST